MYSTNMFKKKKLTCYSGIILHVAYNAPMIRSWWKSHKIFPWLTHGGAHVKSPHDNNHGNFSTFTQVSIWPPWKTLSSVVGRGRGSCRYLTHALLVTCPERLVSRNMGQRYIVLFSSTKKRCLLCIYLRGPISEDLKFLRKAIHSCRHLQHHRSAYALLRTVKFGGVLQLDHIKSSGKSGYNKPKTNGGVGTGGKKGLAPSVTYAEPCAPCAQRTY